MLKLIFIFVLYDCENYTRDEFIPSTGFDDILYILHI